jgi:hypothetical protein
MSNKKKKKKVRVPRQLGQAAWNRTGAGSHVDKKKKALESSGNDWADQLDN